MTVTTVSLPPWVAACGLSLGPAVSNGLARFAYGLLLPAMRQDLSWTYAEAGWINTANAIGYLIGALLALRLVSTIGPRRLYVWGMVATAVALLASGLTHDFWLLSLSRIAAGIGGAPVFIAGGAIVSMLFRGDASRASLAIAIYYGGGGLGMLVSGLSVPFMIGQLGAASWPATWLLLGTLSATATLPSVLAARAVPLPTQSREAAPRAALPIRAMLPALLGYFLFSIGYIVYLTFLVAWMGLNGASAALVAATWGLLGAAVMVSPLPWRGVLAKATGGGALGLACGGTGLGTLLPLLLPGTAGLLLSAAAFGLSLFIGPASVTAFGRMNLPEAMWGRSVALFTTVFAVGQTLGPIAAGLIADASDGLATGLLAAGLTLLLAAIVSIMQRTLRNA
jgi:MFS family permease